MESLPEHFNAAAFFVDRHVAEGRGARPAFRFGGRAITYADLAASVDRCANALAALGVEVEHRVLLVLNDSPAFAAAFWGAAKLGAVAVPVNTLMTPAEYEFLLFEQIKTGPIHRGQAPEEQSGRVGQIGNEVGFAG